MIAGNRGPSLVYFIAEGNAGEAPTHRTPSRDRVSMGLDGVREAARRDRRAPLPSVKLAHPYPTVRFAS